MVTPRRFFDSVVKPNADELFKRHGDLRVAVNAVLSLDAFFGILHAELRSRNDSAAARFKEDGDYRNDLAEHHEQYRIFHDVAATLKHGALTRKQKKLPRLVERVGQIQEKVPGVGVFMVGLDAAGHSIYKSARSILIVISKAPKISTLIALRRFSPLASTTNASPMSHSIHRRQLG